MKNVRRSSLRPPPASEPPPPIEAPSQAAPRPESRAMRVLRGVVGFTMVVAIGGGAAWGARRYVRTSPRFAVTEIMTTGNRHRSAEELAATAGVSKGQNVFGLDLDRAKQKLLADPWISDAKLTRKLPGTIFVHVVERDAAGIIAMATGETALVTRDGAVIKRIEPGDPTDLPVVTGVSADQISADREGATRTIRRALDLAYDYDHAPIAQRASLEEIHVEPDGDVTLVVGKSAVTLRLGAPPYRRKLDQAMRVIGELDRRGAKADTIMLDDEARPDRVVVRMR